MLARLSDPSVRLAMLELSRQIDPADLAPDGVENDPHVTIRYGLDGVTGDEVSDLLGPEPTPSFRLGSQLDAFLAEDTGAEHDVLFVPIEDADDLQRLHDRLGELPHHDTHPHYLPHATVAYLKPGLAAKYVDALAGPGRGAGPMLVAYSDADRVETLVSGEPPETFSDAPKPTALAGQDGRELTRLIRSAQDDGATILRDVTRDAVRRAVDAGGVRGDLFTDEERGRIAAAIAGTTAVADLLGRTRLREKAAWSRGKRTFSDTPFRTFAAEPVLEIAPPERALEYFRGLIPELGIDPERFGEFHRRRAFTLAASTDEVLTAKVQQAITDAIATGKGPSDAAADIDAILDAAGVSASNPQYADLVFRTNASDAYNQAYFEEGRHEDHAEDFPVWKYLGIDDGRQGKDHGPKFDRYYPATATFDEVRGPRPFNCRCAPSWVDAETWRELKAAGARVETTW